MTIEFHCPHCDKLLKTPDDKAGVRANCPGCGQTVTVPDPALEAAQVDPSFTAVQNVAGSIRPVSDAVPPASGQGHDVDEGSREEMALPAEFKPCPMCGESIRQAATRCRYCGEILVRTGTSERVPTKIDAGAILSHAWEIYKKQVGLLVGAIVVVYGVTFGAAMAGSAIQNVILVSIVGPGGRAGNPIAVGLAAMGLMLFFQILIIALSAYLSAGMHVLLLRIARGENAEFVDLFSGMRFFWRFFWGTFLFQIMIGIAFMLFVIPGIVVSLMFWPVFYVIVDRDSGVIDSLRLAHEVTTGNYLAAFILFMAGMGIVLLGIFPGFGIGLLFAIPLVSLLWAVAYCGMNGQLPLQHR